MGHAPSGRIYYNVKSTTKCTGINSKMIDQFLFSSALARSRHMESIGMVTLCIVDAKKNDSFLIMSLISAYLPLSMGLSRGIFNFLYKIPGIKSPGWHQYATVSSPLEHIPKDTLFIFFLYDYSIKMFYKN